MRDMSLSTAGIAGKTSLMQQLLEQLSKTRRFVAHIGLACLLCACGGGGASSDVGAQPAAVPGGVDPGPVTNTGPWTVRLTWNATGDAGVYGYRVYHGVTADNMSDQSGLIGAPSVDLSVATAGRHYFSVAAVDAYNRESPQSPAMALDLN